MQESETLKQTRKVQQRKFFKALNIEMKSRATDIQKLTGQAEQQSGNDRDQMELVQVKSTHPPNLNHRQKLERETNEEQRQEAVGEGLCTRVPGKD